MTPSLNGKPLRPPALRVTPEHIPDELRTGHCFVLWRWELRGDKGGDFKWTKPPLDVGTGHHTRVTNPASGSTFSDAVSALNAKRDVDGLGRILRKDDGLVGIDLDHCRDLKTGDIAVWAQEIIDRCASYSEISPSGQGARVFVHAALPENRNGCKSGPIEMYQNARFLTLTGHRVEGTPCTVADGQNVVNDLYAQIRGEQRAGKEEQRAGKGTDSTPSRAVTARAIGGGEREGASLSLDDVALIHKACTNPKNGAVFSALWRGEWAGQKSESEADAALCFRLAFWADRDSERMDRLFRLSGLADEKWERDDYREATINDAIEMVTETYVGGVHAPADAPRRAETGPHINLMQAKDLANRPRPVYLVDGLLQERTLAALTGDAASFKTFAALGMACAIATGTTWMGHRTVQGPVLYIAAEGADGFYKRVRAWCKDQGDHGVEIPADLWVVDHGVCLTDQTWVTAVLDTLDAISTQPGLVVVDTLSRNFGEKDENATHDMALFVEGMSQIMRRTGGCVLVLYHHAKVSYRKVGGYAAARAAA